MLPPSREALLFSFPREANKDLNLLKQGNREKLRQGWNFWSLNATISLILSSASILSNMIKPELIFTFWTVS